MNCVNHSFPTVRTVILSMLLASDCFSGPSTMFLGRVTAEEANAAEQVARATPLAGLPTKEADSIARIKTMGDDTWLNLGAPEADPKWGRARGRSYTPKMAYAPDLHGAFLYGEGKHGWWNEKTGKYMDSLWVYDSKRTRIYICNDKEENIPIIYDVKTGKWQAPRPATQPLDANTRVLRSASGVMNYDVHGDKAIFFQLRTKGENRPGYFVYDPEANTWTTAPRPFPKESLSHGRNRINSFYDPVLNAHFFHVADVSRDNGVIWVYRNKK